jgi:hypothetical protein
VSRIVSKCASSAVQAGSDFRVMAAQSGETQRWKRFMRALRITAGAGQAFPGHACSSRVA